MGQYNRLVLPQLNLLLAFCLVVGDAGAQDPFHPSNASSSVAEFADRVEKMDPDTAIPFLFNEIRAASVRGGFSAQEPIAMKAAEMIVTINGHAEYLAKKLEEKRGTSDYNQYRTKVFSMLSYVKSAETIEVLGHYLGDSSDALSDDELIAHLNKGYDWAPYSSNAVLAARAFDKLDLEDAPVDWRSSKYNEASIEVWRDWWARRQDGNAVMDAETGNNENFSDGRTDGTKGTKPLASREAPRKVRFDFVFGVFVAVCILLGLLFVVYRRDRRNVDK